MPTAKLGNPSWSRNERDGADAASVRTLSPGLYTRLAVAAAITTSFLLTSIGTPAVSQSHQVPGLRHVRHHQREASEGVRDSNRVDALHPKCTCSPPLAGYGCYPPITILKGCVR
jgi:hypothetical protein